MIPSTSSSIGLLLLHSLCIITVTSSLLTFLITKDSTTSLYTLSLTPTSRFLLGLSGPLLWSRCPPYHPTVQCNSTTYALAFTASTPSSSCLRLQLCHSHPDPSSLSSCTTSCVAYPSNPVTSACAPADLTITSTIVPGAGEGIIASCAPQRLLSGLPPSFTRVIGLSQSPLSLPTQLSFSSLSLKPQFSLCIPSSLSTPGIIAIGSAALTPSSLISFTPLLRNPMKC